MGGYFVAKKTIYQNNLIFYEELLNISNKSKNPIQGQYIKRLWSYMFIIDKHLYRYIFRYNWTKN